MRSKRFAGTTIVGKLASLLDGNDARGATHLALPRIGWNAPLRVRRFSYSGGVIRAQISLEDFRLRVRAATLISWHS